MSLFDILSHHGGSRKADETLWSSMLQISLKHRLLAFLAFLAVMAVSAGAFLNVTPQFRTTASLLVLMSEDYAARPVAGATATAAPSAMDRDAYMSAESDILASDEVIGQAVARVGAEVLYPDLYREPGTVKSKLRAVMDFIVGIDRSSLDRQSSGMAKVRRNISKALSIDIGRSGNVINIAFVNTNGQVAADFVSALIDAYMARRAVIFTDKQATILAQQVTKHRNDLSVARSVLAAFRKKFRISDFALQRELLLKRQSQLEHDLQDTEVVLDETQARHAKVLEQLHALPSDSVQRLNGTEITVRHGTLADGLEQEANKLEQELSAAKARKAGLESRVALVTKEVAGLDQQEGELEDLKLRQSVVERQYADTLQMLNERQSIEAIADARRSNVKVVDKPWAPDTPTSQRLLIAATGLLLALFSFTAILALGWLYRAREIREKTFPHPVRAARDDNHNTKAA